MAVATGGAEQERSQVSVLRSAGDLGRHMLAVDWSTTPLGRPREETHHTFSYNALADDRGDIVGLFCVVARGRRRRRAGQRDRHPYAAAAGALDVGRRTMAAGQS